MIYTMPILWDFSRVKAIWSNVLLRINPIVYVVKGFRDAFVLGMTQDLLYTLYFWGVVLMLFVLGSFLQYRLKKYYADFM
jgi:teichoic acid transport system permease protein